MSATETATETPLRMGAKAQRLISESDKPQAVIDQAVKEATALARERGDRILRDYYLYGPLGIEMPERTKKEWEYFQKNGKEMAGAGSTKTKSTPAGEDGQGNA
jgi:hypothetical protein